MQTFLPYADFTRSAKALDSKRLNKQILEGYQILKVLGNPDPRAAWRNHPAVKMWRGHEFALFEYVATMVVEAQKRGIKTDKNEANLNLLWDERVDTWSPGEPYWFKKPAILRRITTTHKANLYRKDPTYYYKFHTAVTNPNNKPCCDTCQYFWVTHKETV